MRLSALVLALSLSASGGERPDPQRTLALAAVEARGGATAEQASEAGDAMTAQLVSGGRFRVVERQQLARVMKEQALAQSGAMSDEVQVRLAQLVGARFIGLAAVQPSGRGLVLSLRAIDSSTAQVVFADTLRLGGPDQLDAGARQLARALEEKLAGAPVSSSKAGGKAGGRAGAGAELVGDFDLAQVKDSARALARSLAMRFPKIGGTIVESLPDGTATCAFGAAQPFAGQFFEVSGRDDVTESVRQKGWFLLKSISGGACSGRVKRAAGAEVVNGDALASLPVKLAFSPLEAGAGTGPELAKLFADETRSALKTAPQFDVQEQGQLTALGRLSGPRGHRTVELQVQDKGGNVVQRLELPASF
jgi:hypothetical protein